MDSDQSSVASYRVQLRLRQEYLGALKLNSSFELPPRQTRGRQFTKRCRLNHARVCPGAKRARAEGGRRSGFVDTDLPGLAERASRVSLSIVITGMVI